MPSDVSLRLFAHLAARSEAELDLPRAALLLAEPEYPDLDVAAHLERLDHLGSLARARIEHGKSGDAAAELLDLLYGELGFRGNTDDYYDPRNSFLNEVLDRRVGIPITLALVLIEVARRAGLQACGIGFPGHFLVRIEAEAQSPVLVDPFSGRILDAGALKELTIRSTGAATVDAHALEPASKANTLIRMLNNLRGIYAAKEDRARLRGILERLEVLAPSTELRRQIEGLGGVSPPPPRSRSTSLH